MSNIKFEDYSDDVKGAIQQAAVAWLHESAGELQSQVAKNTAVDTGQLKGSWDYIVDDNKLEATVGSPLENAIWEEFGTGEYALKGNGRKGGWRYEDAKGDWHFTRGKKPRRAFWNAYNTVKSAISKRAKSIFGGLK